MFFCRWREITTYEPLEKPDEPLLDETPNSAVSVDVKEAKMHSDVTVTPGDITNTAVDISKNLGDVTKPSDDISKTLDDVSKTPDDIAKTPSDTPIKSSAEVTSHDTGLTKASTQATDVDAVTPPIDTPTDVTAVVKTLPVKPSVTMAAVQNDVTMQPPGVTIAALKREHEEIKPESVVSQLDVTSDGTKSGVTKSVVASDDTASATSGKSDGAVGLGHFEPITMVKVTDGMEGNTSEDELTNVCIQLAKHSKGSSYWFIQSPKIHIDLSIYIVPMTHSLGLWGRHNDGSWHAGFPYFSNKTNVA